MIVENGVGNASKMLVDQNNQAHTFSVTETEVQQAVSNGDAYNINTGEINISATSAVLYFKNDEDYPFHLEAIAVGLKTASVTDTPQIFIVRNPTTGTIIDGASNVDMNQNRNFGSSKTLKSTTLAYKGASANTFTNGNDIAQFQQTANGRLFATIDFEIPKGSSVGIRIEPDLSSGSVDVYAALIGYVKNPKNAS